MMSGAPLLASTTDKLTRGSTKSNKLKGKKASTCVCISNRAASLSALSSMYSWGCREGGEGKKHLG